MIQSPEDAEHHSRQHQLTELADRLDADLMDLTESVETTLELTRSSFGGAADAIRTLLAENQRLRAAVIESNEENLRLRAEMGPKPSLDELYKQLGEFCDRVGALGRTTQAIGGRLSNKAVEDLASAPKTLAELLTEINRLREEEAEDTSWADPESPPKDAALSLLRTLPPEELARVQASIKPEMIDEVLEKARVDRARARDPRLPISKSEREMDK